MLISIFTPHDEGLSELVVHKLAKHFAQCNKNCFVARSLDLHLHLDCIVPLNKGRLQPASLRRLKHFLNGLEPCTERRR